MNITLAGTKVSMDGHTLAFQKNNLVDSMVITVDTDETWQYKLDVKYPCKDSKGEQLYNVIDLTRVGNTCTAILQASMLPFNGKYTMQLRGVSGDKVYHTDTFDVWVKYSIDPGKVYDPVPSEFYQIEQAVTEQAANAKQSATESAESARQSAESATNAAASATKAENAVVHSPIVGENGNWFIWDFTKSEYVDSGKSASTPPITPDTAGKYLTNDGSKAEWGVLSGGSDLSLGITGATIGQTIKVKAVDSSGKPAEWEAIDIPQSDWEQTDESAADYVKNRPFGNFAHHNIDFEVDGEGTGTVKTSLGFDALYGVVGEKTARIKRYGGIICQGKAVTVLDEVSGNITITFTSDDNLTELVFSGQYGGLNSLTINKSNIDWFPWNVYSLFIDGLTYTIYQKLSRDNVEGTLPYTNVKDYIPVSNGDDSWDTRSIESINPIFQLSGASAGQIVKITAVDESGKPTAWESVDMPTGGADLSLGITGATVGQIAKITAVDTDGKPTQWEPVDMAGGETWELINEVTLSEDAMAVVFDKDKSGATFALRKFVVVGTTKGSNASNTNGGTICINVANTADDRYSIVPPVHNHGSLKGDQLRYWHAAAEIIAEKGWRWYLTGADNTSKIDKATIGTNLIRVSSLIPKVATYLAVWSRTSGSAFAAGSNIELYGVRA